MTSNTRRLVLVAVCGVALLWLALLVGLYLLRRAAGPDAGGGIPIASRQGERGEQDEPIRYWEVPAFAGTDQQGRSITQQSLRGRVYVSNFIFTRCTTACPLLTAKMALLWRSIEPPGLGFVSFSVDPEYDTPEVLAAYAATWEGDPRWLLVRMDPAKLPDFARAMNSPLQRQDDALNPILHSSYFFLVDDTGWVRGVYDSIDEDAMQRLVDDARVLAAASGPLRKPTPAGAEVTTASHRGGELFRALGCAACHGDRRLAPSLEGLFGSLVQWEGGQGLADSAYVRTALLDPAAQKIAGYPTVMPSYRRHLAAAELSDLVAYVASLAGEDAPPRPAASDAAKPMLTLDPVCEMGVAARPDNPHAEYAGKTWYFCSEYCRELFVKDPARYTASR